MKRKKLVSIISIILLFIVSFTLLGGTKTSFESIKKGVISLFAKNSDGSPLHEKNIQDNKDGTYTLSLDVVGESEKVVPKANVIVIMDVSGSMNTDTGNGEVTYTETTSNYGVQYGIVNGEYVRIYRVNNAWRLTNTNNGTRYTGTRYTRQQANQTRLEAAKDAVNDLAEALLAHNGNGNPNNTIEMALVRFSNTASVVTFSGNTTKTNSYTTFSNSVNGLSANGGTNWEDGLLKANTINFNDTDPTYVIFVSDGNPTFRQTQNGYNDWSSTYGAYGTGQETTENISRCYTTAVPAAKAIVDANKTFYTIGVYGNVDRMESLTTSSGAPAANYYAAADTAALQEALNAILEQIETAGFASVEIDDGTTSYVATTSSEVSHLLEVDTDTFTYYKNGVEWSTSDGAPEATLSDKGEVIWDLSSLGVLEDGVKYTVKFDVYPSQETYDLIADLKNGNILYSDLHENIRKYLHDNGDGTYTLSTNTTATLKYDDTRDAEGIQTSDYNVLPPVNTEASQMIIKKDWQNDLDGRTSDKSVTMYLLKDGNRIPIGKDSEGKTIYENIEVNNSNNWQDSRYISTGLLRTIKNNGAITGIRVLDAGHDYTLVEPENIAYYWELDIETVHPMIIDGKLTTLIEVFGDDIPSDMGTKTYYQYNGHTFYNINGNIYYERTGSSASLTATNNRKSNLNITKNVTGDADKEKEFEFRMQVSNYNEEEVWFSVYDEENNIVKNIKTSATKEDGDTGYYYFNSGDTITVSLQSGWNLRFINLSSGSTYEIEEINIPSPYELSNVEGTTIITSTLELPIGAINNNDGTYTYGETIYTEKTGTNSDGVEYTYYEYKYTPTIENKKVNGEIVAPNTSYEITYTNNYPKTRLTVNKEWLKTEKESVTVDLYQNGVKLEDKTVTFKDTYTFEDLEVFDENLNPYTYSVIEHDLDGYQASYSSTSNVIVKATNVKEGIESINAILKIDDERVQAPLTKDNNWTYTIEDVEFVNLDGTLKTISIEQVENATVSYTYEARTITITNEETTNIKATKVWVDANNQDGLRDTVVLHLNKQVEGGEVTVVEGQDKTITINSTSLEVTWENLPVYENGNKITYTVTEEEITGYTTTITGDMASGYTVTNSHIPATTNVTATKVWEDAGNQDGLRDTVVLHLNKQVADGEKVVVEGQDKTITTDATSLEVTWENLPVYESGNKITYTVTEEALTGYETEITGDMTKGFTVTNTHEPENIEVTVIKDWQDDSNRDGIRPDDLKVTLYNKDDNSVAGETTLEDDGNGNWSHTFTVPKFKAGKQGVLINYDVKEDEVPDGYTNVTPNKIVTDADGNCTITIVNKHDNETIDIKVTKDWQDGGNRDNSRPESITIKLLAKGEATGDTVILDSSNQWTATFEGLTKNEDGEEIIYTIEEDGTVTDSEGVKTFNVTKDNKTFTYTVTESGSMEDGYTITNTYEPETTNITVTKDWQDGDNRDNSRPQNVNVELLADGVSTDTIIMLSQSNSWTNSFTKLPKNKDGKEIIYTVKEVGTVTDSEGVETLEVKKDDKTFTYTVTKSGNMKDGYTITNTYEPEETSITVTKDWQDADDQDGIRPASVTIKLLAEGEATGDTVILDSSNQWTGTFEHLVKNKAGVAINYTVEEDGTVTDSQGVETFNVTKDDKTFTYTVTKSGNMKDGYTITNTHTPSKIAINGEKIWIDSSDQDGKRPGSVKVRLLADDIEVASQDVTGTEDNWQYTFSDLPEYKDGSKIVYTVKEDPVDDYTTDIDGFTIKNTHKTEKVPIKGQKIWEDDENRDNSRPFSILVTLNRTVGTLVLDPINIQVTANENWAYDFGELDKFYKGTEIVYTITEGAVSEYDTHVDGYNIINTRDIDTIDIVKTKVWDDDENRDGARPKEITVILKADGVEVARTTTTEEKGWEYEFTKLPKNRKGKVGEAIVYTVEEESVEGYVVSDITDYVITNHHDLETISFKVTKEWYDYNNEDQIRPDKITVRLLADGVEVDSMDITEANNWTYTFTNHPRYRSGEVKQPIEYTIIEDEVKGYITTVGEYITSLTENQTVIINNTITNTHEPTITIEGEKTWEDFDNKYDSRPKEITIYLYKKDELYKTIIVSSETDWKYVIENLNKYADGEEITYTIREESVEGYETTYDGYNILNTIIWNEGDGSEELPPQTGIEVSFNNILYIIISGVLFILGNFLKQEESK